MSSTLKAGGESKGKVALMAERILLERMEHPQEIKITVIAKHIFEQIREPIITDDNVDAWFIKAKASSIGLVIDKGATWIIAYDETGLWRWAIFGTDELDLDAAFEEHTWLATVPQVFLEEWA